MNLAEIESLVQRFHADVYRYAYRLSGSQADAEDLTQQAFLVAQQRLHQVRQPERVRGWLFAVTRTCYLKSVRKRQPVSAAAIEMDVEEIPDTAAETEVDSQRLQQLLDELPDEFKVVLMLFYFEECSYREIATQLKIPVGTVMSRLARAKGRLRRRLLAIGEAIPADRESRKTEGKPEAGTISAHPSP